MTRIPLLSGIITDQTAEFRQTYPTNLEPVAVDNKINKGQLRATAGAIPLATGPGIDRGGCLWNDGLYRVMGTKLVQLSRGNTITTLGDVGGEGQCAFAMGFDRFGIRSGDKLFYWDGVTLTQVTDIDLGPVVDVIWIDSYFMSTDGTHVVVTELSNPLEINPLKYGSAEDDPDAITGLIKFRQEAYVLGRYTIQVFRNIGGNGFPFQTLRGATIPYGCVGPNAKCLFGGSFAFIGSARNEALGVYIAGQGDADRISTRAIEDELAKVEAPADIILENRTARGEQRLFIHLPTKSLVFLLAASEAWQTGVWYIAQSGYHKPYRLRSAIGAYNQVIVGDIETGLVGKLTDEVCTHFGEPAQWEFDMGLIYNEGKGAILHKVELIGLPGRAAPGVEGTAWLSLSRDGVFFTTERDVPIGGRGRRGIRMQWRPKQSFHTFLGLRVRGYSAAMPGFAACEAQLTPLTV